MRVLVTFLICLLVPAAARGQDHLDGTWQGYWSRAGDTRIGTVLCEAGNTQLTIRILPGADHTFRLRPGPSGWPVTAPDYIPSLVSWLAQRRGDRRLTCR